MKELIYEPQRSTPVMGEYDVAVVGGGVAVEYILLGQTTASLFFKLYFVFYHLVIKLFFSTNIIFDIIWLINKFDYFLFKALIK